MQFTAIERSTVQERQVWRFWYDDRGHSLRCSQWARATRLTARHKYRIEEEWSSTGRRGRSEKNPPLPEDVILEALRTFAETLVFEPWA